MKTKKVILLTAAACCTLFMLFAYCTNGNQKETARAAGQVAVCTEAAPYMSGTWDVLVQDLDNNGHEWHTKAVFQDDGSLTYTDEGRRLEGSYCLFMKYLALNLPGEGDYMGTILEQTDNKLVVKSNCTMSANIYMMTYTRQ